ncbi:hypothetical protein [Xanthomonas oryzae]|uniref:Uncharacterized protein n=1 Tax=Xanthomonas oryzae pv. oryzicola (strain BLS256) TaxID=383407 RepID=G7THS0_XANOB|nr:hypothetical protein [Xanthomonas oryzae]AEQ98055.1 hypothetical protein XOC_3966 [Xanthomonas oryzae pv. oryzicola BLS256]AKK65363.1 hypothetical protein FE36_16870 [Xanthomonas oryzae pv. oryzicola]AKN94631.1 hypothetical protein ACU13_18040 [Xanthomonas oryzae pv. oryzicola]AKN98354.1 hypothetical protein ACU10_17965 [Xanthomonas oryzae pv. oryzicola]AKO13582.1 hypothetical protein ACU14_17965 [Xanthomonas oryzae pv. oryzicola]
MSRNSKAKRDKRKKQQPKRPFARLGQAPQVTNHAVLQDAEGRVVAAIGLQGGSEWMLSIGGQTMGSADNPVPMLALLKHLANLQQAEGKTIWLEYSTQLQQMIDELAADEGQTAEEYLNTLVAEFQNADADEDGDADAEDAADAAGTDAVAEDAAAENATASTDDSAADTEASDDAESDSAGEKARQA